MKITTKLMALVLALTFTFCAAPATYAQSAATAIVYQAEAETEEIVVTSAAETQEEDIRENETFQQAVKEIIGQFASVFTETIVKYVKIIITFIMDSIASVQ